jgi:hypothetical protein
MTKPTVYIETSIISFLTSRPSWDLSIVWRQQTTREWWETCREDYLLYISDAVLDEISLGDKSASALRLDAVRDIDILYSTPQSDDLAQILLDSHALPKKAATDAQHISIAACHGMDFLLTWNCKHIANPFTERLFEKIITQNGYRFPVMATPDRFDSRVED